MKSTLQPSGIQHLGTRVALAALALGCAVAPAQTLTLTRRIELPAVQGRIDHLALDVEGGRLFIAALGSDSLEVVNLRAGQRVDRIKGLHEPQGVLYLPSTKRVVVANGSGGGVQAFADGKAPAVAAQTVLDDADNLRWDATADSIYVGFGSALAELDASTLKIKRRIMGQLCCSRVLIGCTSCQVNSLPRRQPRCVGSWAKMACSGSECRVPSGGTVAPRRMWFARSR